MYLFFMLVLTVIVIAAVVWLYLYLSRRALDNSMSGDNAAKPLVRSPRTTGGKAWENPVAAGAAAPTADDRGGTSGGSIAATSGAETITGDASGGAGMPAATAPAKGGGAGKSGKGGGKSRNGATKGASATASGPAKTGKGGKSGKSGKGTKAAKAGGKARGAAAQTEAVATAPVASLAAVPPEAPDGPLFVAPSGAKDKLTDIKGIGPVAERQLNEQGITTFAQIAALTAKDIVRIDAYMPFSDRQIRDWQKQAKKKA